MQLPTQLKSVESTFVCYPLTIKVRKRSALAALKMSAGTEVNQLGAKTGTSGGVSGSADDDVLVLDVPVNDPAPVAFENSFEHLGHKVLGGALVQLALLGDEVKEVLGGLGPLQDEDEGIWALVEVQ